MQTPFWAYFLVGEISATYASKKNKTTHQKFLKHTLTFLSARIAQKAVES